jgi:hypothetical protein
VPPILCRRWASARRTAAAWVCDAHGQAEAQRDSEDARIISLSKFEFVDSSTTNSATRERGNKSGRRRKFISAGPRICSTWNKRLSSSSKCFTWNGGRRTCPAKVEHSVFRILEVGANRAETAMTRGRFLPLQLPVDANPSVG